MAKRSIYSFFFWISVFHVIFYFVNHLSFDHCGARGQKIKFGFVHFLTFWKKHKKKRIILQLKYIAFVFISKKIKIKYAQSFLIYTESK